MIRGPLKILKGTPQRGGLLRVCLRSGTPGTAGAREWWTFIHVVILTTFVGPRPSGMEGCHINGDPADNRLENLRWDTHASNMQDAIRHGTHNFIRDNPNHGRRRWLDQ